MQTQQQIDRNQNERLDRLEREVSINRYRDQYGGKYPRLYGMELVESLSKLFNHNISIWETIILNMGSAYARAHTSFNYAKRIQEIHQAQSWDQMAYNIIAAYAIVGLGWFGPVAQAVIDKARIEGKPKSVEEYFSSGFQSIVSNSKIRFGSLPAVKFDRQKELPKTNPGSVLNTPFEFHNNLDLSFTACANKVRAQFRNMVDQFKNPHSKANKSLRRHFGDLEQDAINPKVMLDNLIPRMNGAYTEVKNLVRQMNAHLVETSYYFSYKPGFPVSTEGKDSPFINFMAVLFERVMWAGWIPNNLRRVKKSRYMKARYQKYTGNYPEDSMVNGKLNLQILKPGIYRDWTDSHYDVQIIAHYINPSITVVEHLEKLGIVKRLKGSPIDKGKLTPLQMARMEALGCAIDDNSAKVLIAWAQEQNRVLCPYTGSKFKNVKRDNSELYLRELA